VQLAAEMLEVCQKLIEIATKQFDKSTGDGIITNKSNLLFVLTSIWVCLCHMSAVYWQIQTKHWRWSAY
jgi:hypothetical protein